MKKNYSHTPLAFIYSFLLFFVLFSGGNIQAQCTTPTNQAVSSSPANLACNGSVTVALANSQNNVAYYLRNDANNAILAGPFFGTGSALNLVTGNISSNTTFNVNAVGPTRAMFFDGVDDQALIANAMSTSGDFTWETWFYANAGGVLISIGQPSGNYTTGGKTLFIRNSRLSFDCYGINYIEAPSYVTGVLDGKWHHVAITNKANYNGSLDRTTMYMDGQLILVKSDWDITGSQNTGMVNRLGYNAPDFPSTSGSNPAFSGLMDDAKFWSTERTQNEVISDMSACPAGGTTGLDAFYKFEDGTSTALTDNGAGTHPGVLTNMGTPNTASDGRDACSTCAVNMTTKPVVTISTLLQQATSALTPSFCTSGSTTITAAGSEINANYYLSNSTNTTVQGPVAGTGGALNYATGTLNSTTTYTITGKRLSGALNFDGVDDIISVNETPALAQFSTTPMTMEAWVYPTNISTIRSVIRKEGSYNLYLNNGRIYFEMYRNLGGGTNYTITLGQTILPVNQWSHIAASWQGGIYADIYLNGTQEIIGGGSSTNNNVAPMSIGRTAVSNQPFAGKLDDIRIWNTARTAAQIKANMRTCLTGSESGLLLNYKFDDTGNTIIDAAGGDNTGTLLNSNPATNYATGVDNCGCTLAMTPSPTVTIYATPTIAVNNATICSGNSAVITPTGAGANANYTITGGTFTVSPTAATNYSVTGTNSAGCVAGNTAVSAVSVNTTPTVSATSGTICSGQSFNIVPSGANSYNITGGTFNVTPSVTTSYSVTGTSSGCASSNTFVTTIVVNTTPTLAVNSATICSGNSVAIVPTGAGTYTITGGNYTVSPNTTTSYSVTGTGSNGCAAINTVVSTVSVNTTPTLSVNSATICSGNSVAIVPTGAGTYTITGGNYTVSPNTTTSYSVTGTAANGCPASNTIVSTVSVNITPTLSVNSATICSGNSAVISPSGASTYSITGGSFNVSPNTTTAYSVTGTAANGCPASNTIVSTVSVNITPTLAVNSATICSGNSVAIVPTGAGTYTITGGNFTVSPGATTSYSVTGTTNGCPASNTIVSTVSVNITPTLSVNNATICSGNTAVISPSGASTYSITGGSFNVSPNTTTAYSVTGTAANGCPASNTIVSTVSVNITPTLSVNSATICSGNSVAIVPTGAGTYTITGGSYTVSPNTTTSYSVTGTGTNACMASNTAVSTISVNTTPTLSVNNATICSTNSVAIVPSGANTYTITGGSFTVSPLTTTSYSVTGTATNGCAATNTAVSAVLVNATPTLAINSGAICPGNSYTLIPSGAGTYTITGGAYTVTPASTTSYTLTGIGANGCAAGNSAVATVSVVNTLTVSVTGATNVCSGRATTLTASGASSYSWSSGGITTNTIALSPTASTTYTVYGASGTCSNTAVVSLSVLTTPTLTVNSATICSNNSVAIVPSGAPSYTITGGSFTVSPATTTSYSVTGTATNNCISNPAVSTISVNTTPTLSVNSATICSGNSLAIVPTGAGTYTITGGNFTVALLSNASYSVTGTGTNGCIGFNTAVSTVSVKTTPTVTVNSAAICSGNSVALVAGGANTYTITGNSFTVSPTANASYSVTGTSTNGCISGVAVSNVTVNALPVISVNSGVICPGNSFTLVPTGAATYTYSNGSNIIVNPAVSNNYSVTGTSAQGCHATNTAVATVSVVNTLTITVAGPTAICTGQTATLTANGATTYTWDTGIVSNTIALNPTTTTTYTVSGVSGTCSNTAVVSLSVNALPAVSVNSGQVCPGNTFVIVPTGADTYSITGNTFSVNPSVTSSYSVSGTDLNGCVSAEAVSNVTVNALPVVTAVSDNSFTCIGVTTTLTANGADTYSWSSGQSDAVIAVTPTETTIYTVVGFDANGCSASAVVTQSVTDCTGIKSFGKAGSFVIALYPNPTAGAFIIDLNENARVIVYNNIGQEIVNETRSAGKQSFGLQNEAHGIYFVKVIVNNKQQAIKLIKE